MVGYPIRQSRSRTLNASPEDIVPLAGIKSWMRIPHTDDDALLENLRSSAIAQIEKETNLYLTAAEIVATYCPRHTKEPLGLTELPVQSLTSVMDGATNLSLTLEQDGPFYRLYAPSAGWSGDEVVIIYTAGLNFATHPDAAQVREAAWMLIAGSYENREAEAERPFSSNPALRRVLRGLYIPRLFQGTLE